MSNYTIEWDCDWGVPHVQAETMAGIAEGLGYAQAHLHPTLLPLAMLRAQGVAAQYIGAHTGPGPGRFTKFSDGVDLLQSDRLVRQLQVMPMAQQWLAQQDPEMKACVAGFAAGINHYFANHPDALDPLLAAAGPVTELAVMANVAHFLLGFQLMIRTPTVAQWHMGAEPSNPAWRDFAGAGSNSAALAPSKSRAGHPMLMVNPHSQWDVDLNAWCEARISLTDGSGFTFQGAGMMGWPLLMLGCSAHGGIASTVNSQNSLTFYQVVLDQHSCQVDGQPHGLARHSEKIQVRQADGSLMEENQEVIWSQAHQAYCVGQRQREGRTENLLVHVPNRPYGQVLRQFMDMTQATCLAEFKQALARQQLPMFNVLYAGRDQHDQQGHIHYNFQNLAPQRGKGQWADWWPVLDGHHSTNIALGIVPFDELFSDSDSDTGWYQNCNDSPYSVTLPSPFDPADYHPWLAPVFTNFRAQNLSRLILSQPQFDLQEFIDLKLSTRVELAGRLVPFVEQAVNDQHSALLQQAMATLSAWDRHANPDSRGCYLFLHWILALDLQDNIASPLFADAWRQPLAQDPQRYMESINYPEKIADPEWALACLEQGAQRVLDEHGDLAVAWGDAVTMSHGKYSYPAVGACGDPFGMNAALPLAPAIRPWCKGGALPANRIENDGGETFVMVVEFTEQGARGGIMTSYGASSDINSRHYGDQLQLVAERRLRPFSIDK